MKTGKRIVSVAEYAASVGKVTALSSLCTGFLLVGGIAGVSVFYLLREIHNPTGVFWDDWGESRLFTLFFGVVSLLFLSLGAFTMHHIRKIDIGIPLTRANTADLPADKSLVRASQEPVQEQQSILLRAATEVHTTPPEQLLRPAQAQEKAKPHAEAKFCTGVSSVSNDREIHLYRARSDGKVEERDVTGRWSDLNITLR